MENASAPGTARRLLSLAGCLAGTVLVAAGCGGTPSSPSNSNPSNSASQAGQAANATPSAAQPTIPAAGAGTESPPPGDIPDTTAYVAYDPASGLYQVKVPEGWARTVTGSTASFTDKLNIITLSVVKTTAPTPATARATEVPKIQSAVRHFTLTGIGTVRRSAGPAVLIRYSAFSQPDPVTGKVYTDAVERYEFYRNGMEAVVTLSAPSGADNVDPWRTVTNSFQWLR
jgi:hypothetical protein